MKSNREKPIKDFKFSSLEEYLSRYIDLFSLLYIPEDSWLRDREKDYFIECVKLNSEGKNLLSKEVKRKLEDELGFISRQYRLLLKNKGWIIQTKDGIQILPAFDFKGEIPQNMLFKFRISC